METERLTDKVLLRNLTKRDIDRMAEMANNSRISRMLRDGFPHPFTKKNAIEFLERIAANDPQTSFAIEWNDLYVGNIGLHPKDDIYRASAELGYFISEEFWGRGIASAAIGQMVTYGFNKLNLVRIEAGVFHVNPASMKVLEKNGFIKEGIAVKAALKNGQLMDEHRYAIINPNIV